MRDARWRVDDEALPPLPPTTCTAAPPLPLRRAGEAATPLPFGSKVESAKLDRRAPFRANQSVSAAMQDWYWDCRIGEAVWHAYRCGGLNKT